MRWYQCVRVTGDFKRVDAVFPPTRSWLLAQWQVHCQGWKDIYWLLTGKPFNRVALLTMEETP